MMKTPAHANRGMLVAALLALVGLDLSSSGCGAVIHGSKQTVQFSSAPKGASVSAVDGQSCETPCSLRFRRNEDQAITIELAGYEPAMVELESEVDGGPLAGDIVLSLVFFPIGLVSLVDLQGGMFMLEPGVVTTRLKAVQGARAADGSPLKDLTVAVRCAKNACTLAAI